MPEMYLCDAEVRFAAPLAARAEELLDELERNGDADVCREEIESEVTVRISRSCECAAAGTPGTVRGALEELGQYAKAAFVLDDSDGDGQNFEVFGPDQASTDRLRLREAFDRACDLLCSELPGRYREQDPKIGSVLRGVLCSTVASHLGVAESDIQCRDGA